MQPNFMKTKLTTWYYRMKFLNSQSGGSLHCFLNKKKTLTKITVPFFIKQNKYLEFFSRNVHANDANSAILSLPEYFAQFAILPNPGLVRTSSNGRENLELQTFFTSIPK